LVFGIYHIKLVGQRRIVRYLDHELAEELPLLIARGEGEHLEFKTSLRWDIREQRASRVLEQVVVKTIAGFLNHEGGTLLIGVEDCGNIVGIEPDFQTLKHANRDGFERALMDAIKNGLGGNACPLTHCQFHDVGDKTVCRVIIEKSLQPVYYLDGRVARFLLRAGNSTRELDVREAQAYLSQRSMANA
jgi:predicted HTH transcriptional regulator